MSKLREAANNAALLLAAALVTAVVCYLHQLSLPDRCVWINRCDGTGYWYTEAEAAEVEACTARAKRGPTQ